MTTPPRGLQGRSHAGNFNPPLVKYNNVTRSENSVISLRKKLGAVYGFFGSSETDGCLNFRSMNKL